MRASGTNAIRNKKSRQRNSKREERIALVDVIFNNSCNHMKVPEAASVERDGIHHNLLRLIYSLPTSCTLNTCNLHGNRCFSRNNLEISSLRCWSVISTNSTPTHTIRTEVNEQENYHTNNNLQPHSDDDVQGPELVGLALAASLVSILLKDWGGTLPSFFHFFFGFSSPKPS